MELVNLVREEFNKRLRQLESEEVQQAKKSDEEVH